MNGLDTKFGSTRNKRIAMGGVILILAGILQLVQVATSFATFGLATGGALSNLEYAVRSNSSINRFGLALAGIFLAFLILGVFALYAHLARTKQERLAFIGLVFTIVFTVMFIPLLTFAAYVIPAVGALIDEGKPEMVEALDQMFREPFLPIPFFAAMLRYVGHILLGLAVWRAGTPWKPGGLIFIVTGVAGIPIFFLDTPGGVLIDAVFAIAVIGIGFSLRRVVSGASNEQH